MAASVRIEDEAFSDERYEDLAAAAGLTDADHARGKMARIWRQCTLEQTHVIHRLTLERILGPRAVDALVSARLGDKVDENTVRIRGTEGRIEWLQKLRDNGKFGSRGGRPRKTSKPTRVSENAKLETPPAPAPVLIPEREERALPDEKPTRVSSDPESTPSKPSPGAITTADSARSPEIQKVIPWAWNYAANEFGKLVAAGVPGAARTAWGGTPGSGYPPMTALGRIVDELAIAHASDPDVIRGRVKNRVDVAIREARDKRDAQYVTPARMWNPQSFAIAVDLDPAGRGSGRPIRVKAPSDFADDEAPPFAAGGKP